MPVKDLETDHLTHWNQMFRRRGVAMYLGLCVMGCLLILASQVVRPGEDDPRKFIERGSHTPEAAARKCNPAKPGVGFLRKAHTRCQKECKQQMGRLHSLPVLT